MAETKKKIVWVNVNIDEDLNLKKQLVVVAIECGFTDFIVHKNDVPVFQKLGKISTITIEGGRILIDGEHRGQLFVLRNKQDEENVKKMAGKIDYVAVSAVDWKVIPIENLIAAFQKTHTKLLVGASNMEEAKLFLEALEVGVDGVVLNTLVTKEIIGIETYLRSRLTQTIKLISGKVTKIKPIGTGDRVCIDTCSLLDIGEGVLVGSQSTGMFLVHSETIASQYVNPRPFRVNAGAVHTYILLPSGETKYLSELHAGDEVLLVNSNGVGRVIVVGRVKIERRPLLLLETDVDGKRYNTIVQNAETTRLVSKEGAVSVAELKVGDLILMHIEEAGRHFGMPVKEHIKEN
jgi:3-dehydroquinate synthase II